MIERLTLPGALLAQIEDEARAASPRECCGLLVGRRDGHTAEIFLAHPTLNLSERDHCFEIDPRAQFALLHALRGSGRGVIGCYHSHPNGRTEPSPRDLAGASEADFVWLIAAVHPQGECSANAFLFNGCTFEPLDICEPFSLLSARC